MLSHFAKPEAIVIGASSGAVPALKALLPHLPANLRAPVIVVVHIPAQPPSLLVRVFEHGCALPVREPMDKAPVEPGIWFAPAGYHLLIEAGRTFALSIDLPVHFSRPSIDVLFESAARCYGSKLLGVVLTGANADGAEGTATIRSRGGIVVAQDPRTAQMSTMPRAAIEAGAIQMSLEEILGTLVSNQNLPTELSS